MADMEFVNEYLNKVINLENRDLETDVKISELLKKLKAEAVEQNDQERAKLIWCTEQILNIQNTYLSAFQKMKEGSYYEAWGLLERVEIDIYFLEPHLIRDNKSDPFMLDFIETHTRQFQSLFPYKLFVSPAFLQLEKICSICGRVVSIWHPCGHKKGEIYNGEMCVHEITKGKILELSVVPNPVQKYSVLFTSKSETGENIDHYDYQQVKYAINGLGKPFDAWEVRWMKIRHPHSLFSHLSRHDCPCGSGKKYEECCLPNPKGVLRPHVEFRFSVPPPENLPAIIYPGYK